MLPMRFFANRTFTAANIASMMMFFGMFGAIFLLTQFLQTVQGYSPLSAGLRVLPWTAMPLIVAPIAGALSDRIGGRMLMATGIAMQSIALVMLAALASPTVAYSDLIGPFMIAGIGMGLFFAPVANVVLGSVRPRGGGPGLGRQQRHPRARRGAGRLGPGDRLRPVRQLPVRRSPTSTG